MTIVLAVLAFLFARQLGRTLGYIAGWAIAALVMGLVAPAMLLVGAFRRRKALRALRRAAQGGRQKAIEPPAAPQEATQRPKAPVIPIRPEKRS